MLFRSHLASLFVSDIAAVDDPPVRLLNAVAADWIIEKEGKIAEQIKLVVLRIGIGKELTVCLRIVVIIQFPIASQSVSAFRGIDGTELSDAVKYIDRLVLRYEPRLVVVYAGDNDIGGGKISEQVSVDFERFVRAVHAKLPETRILYIGIKPSPLRWLQVDRMRLANQVIRTICERDDRLAFLDFDNLMLGWDEKPRRDLYVEDGLHLSPQGYQLWTAVLKPYLVQQ